MKRGLLLPLCLLLSLSPAARGAPPAAPLGLAAGADHASLERVLSTSGVETVVPQAGVLEYSRYLGQRLVTWFYSVMLRGAEAVFGARGWFSLVGRAVIVLAILALAILVVQLARRSVARARAAGPVAERRLAEAPAAAERDDAGWRSELERRLAAGEVGEALAALWWWLALRLAGASADPTWTSRELAAATGRRDLLADLGRLDAMAYGPRPPAAAEVLGLWRHFEARLAERGGQGAQPAAGGGGAG